jgi:hypothetical protein
MKTTAKILCVMLALILFSCTNEDIINESSAPVSTNDESATSVSTNSKTSSPKITSPSTLKTWSFDNLNEWVDATQVGVPNYFIDNGNLNISTHANTYDRTKIKSVASYTTGTYTWKVYVPTMGEGDMASIGAFLYNNDTHELDFEIGYGKQSERTSLNALSDELIVYMTSQANPAQTYRKTIKREQWYTLSIQLTLVNRNYYAKWIINNEVLGSTPLNYGTRFKFNIFCSMENLAFIGDHIPYSDNYALFDFVEYNPN